jgi:DNA integrity scanning protein DisA with diadenylate cyclase activity
LHEKIVPKGYRFLSKIKSLSPAKIDNITKRFQLKELFDIDVDEFSELSGLDKKECLEILEETRKLKNELISKL